MSDQGDYWTDYNRGAAGLPPRNGMFRTWGERAGYDTTFNSYNGGQNGGGAGGGIAILALLAVAVAAIVAIAGAAAVASILALPAAYLLIAVTALFTGGHRLSFTESYKTSFLGLVVSVTLSFAIVLGILHGVLPGLLSVSTVIWLITEPIDLTLLGAAEWINAAIGALILLAPGLIAFALILGRRIGHPYAGGLGVVRGIGAALAVLVPTTIGFGAAVWFVATYGEPLVRTDEIGEYLAVTLGLVLIMALVGGLLLGLLLMAFGGGLTKGGPMFRTAWFTAAVAMAISGGTAALAIVFFRDADNMLATLITLSGAGKMTPTPLMDALPGFLKLTAPGAVAGAAFVAGSLYAYRGLLGWLKAFLVTVPVSLACLAGTVMALAQLR